ncbi:MAG TPA: hypothetical protein VHB20_00640 [Verrucomicrobiae bacterium]|jgi:hypothetical protein|nr:hypothetical protein [Verrucomicrobiae bacterium]
MDARQQIADLLQQWRELSQAEFKAIQAGDWANLKTLQAAKETLQHGLTAARETWNAENPTLSLSPLSEHPFADVVSSLVALETRNEQLLEARRQKVRDRQLLLKQARGNIRRVRHSYAGYAEAKWNSYS